MRVAELGLPFAGCSIVWAIQDRAGELSLLVWVQESWWVDQIKYLSDPNQGLELSHPNIYHINELLKYMMEPVLQDLNDTEQ